MSLMLMSRMLSRSATYALWACCELHLCKAVEHTVMYGMAAAQKDADATQRLLTYRWYPTSLNNWDGRLLVASGLDLDQSTGCERVVAGLILAHLAMQCS